MSRQLLLILCACITLVCVVSCKDTTENESALFFANPRFKGGDYFKTIPIFYPDSVVAHIRAEVPSKWWGLACEGAFLNLPDSVPNAQLFQHLAAYERAFPHDSVHAFAQLMRGRTLISELKYDSALFYLNDCYNISQRDNRPIRAGDAKYYSGQVAMRRGNFTLKRCDCF